jgi:hypothetical protein
MTLYWQARQPLATNYSALAQLVDDHQHLYGGQDNLHPGNLPPPVGNRGALCRISPGRVPASTPPVIILVTGLMIP